MADAITRITDSIVPSVYAQYGFEEHVQSLDIYQAGVLYSDPDIVGRMSMGGRTVIMPAWKDLGNDPSEPANDDPNDEIETKKIGTKRDEAPRLIRAQAWADMDLVSIIAGDDPHRIIVNRQSDYWQRANKTTILAMLTGVIADNIANDSSDLVYSTSASITDETVIRGAYKMGDRADEFAAIWMHSQQMLTLKLADLIDMVPSSEQGGMLIPTYMNLRVITDDDCPVSGTTYTSFLMKRKAIHWAELPMNTEGGPLEFKRNPKAGHGGGMTEVVARRHMVPAIRGTRFLSTTVAGETPSDAELRLAANWDRTASSKKSMPVVAVKSVET